MAPIDNRTIRNHFPNIYQHCLEEGYDVTKECIPVVPAQHYFMGGVDVDRYSKTSMEQLYAIGETSCNGVHGANRLASNSLLESLVFAKRAAKQMTEHFKETVVSDAVVNSVDTDSYRDYRHLQKKYKEAIFKEIERMKEIHERDNDEVKC